MGPIDSPLAKFGVEVTDSKYVVLNMAIMNNLAAQIIRIYQAVSDLSPYMAKMDIKDEPMPCLRKIVAIMNSEEVIARIKEEIVKVKKLKLQNRAADE